MDNYVSKAGVCEIIADLYPIDGEHVVDIIHVDKAYEKVLALPSVRTEITRCKDCEHYQFSTRSIAFGYPVRVCKLFVFEDMGDDDFCSRAKRKIRIDIREREFEIGEAKSR